MNRKRELFAAFCLVFSIISNAALGQPSISGELTGSLGPGAYLVVGDCDVPAGQVLVILPNTRLLFSGHYNLAVYGQLNAEGTETDSIHFTRQFPTEDCKHGGIRFLPGSSASNTLSYCWIEYADNPDFPDCFGGAILCQESGVTILHCTIMNSLALYGGGIYIYGSTVSVSQSLISGCQAIARGGAIYTINSTTEISDCVVVGNSADLVGGICIYNNDDAQVRNSIVASNTATSVAT